MGVPIVVVVVVLALPCIIHTNRPKVCTRISQLTQLMPPPETCKRKIKSQPTMCQVHTGAYVSLLAPGKTDYTACHPRKTTTYILHVVPITTHTHDRRKSNGKKKQRKGKKIQERKEKTRTRKVEKGREIFFEKKKKEKQEKTQEQEARKREREEKNVILLIIIADPRNF